MCHTDRLSTLLLCYFFRHLIKNRLFAATATVIDQVVSDKWKLYIF